ncbi:MAG TPA: glycosyltransferase family 2 protein [Planctomycetaceae bacterium]|jgi:putative glycosyltransferase|nr:glycosyltransferase family 2 protein [Planctomycetaceae bacterium]
MLISVVTTLYRSSPYLEEFYARTLAAVRQSGQEGELDVEFIFVDDGSPDDSAAKAREFIKRQTPATLVELSRNFGHHRAILTGLSFARGDLIFLIDCDLEEPPELFGEMLRTLEQTRDAADPADVVYAVPHRRKGGVFERVSGELFYRLFNLLSDVQVPNNWMICRLMTARYVRALLSHHERELFLGGLFGITGFRQVAITADKKHKGSTTWTLRRKLKVALQAVTAFSARPLWLLAGIGSLISVGSAAAILYMIVRVTIFGMPYQSGWASTMVTISFFGGLNLLAIGIVGLYIAQIFAEVKGRPCIVKEVRANFAREATTIPGVPAAIETVGHGTIAIAATSVENVPTSSPIAVPSNGNPTKPAVARPASEPRHA